MSSKTFRELLRDLQGAHWREAEDLIAQSVRQLDEEEVNDLLYNGDSWSAAVSSVAVSHWVLQKLLSAIALAFSDDADSILKSSTNDYVKTIFIEKGLYSDVSILDHIAKNSSGEAQVMAAHYCSVDILRTLMKSKSTKIRKIAFQRLGPVECLDDMLEDKIADIRHDAVRMAPFGYSKLNDMTKEIARGPFSLLVEKISAEYLPMLLANRNLKNSWISSRLKNRLDIEGEENV